MLEDGPVGCVFSSGQILSRIHSKGHGGIEFRTNQIWPAILHRQRELLHGLCPSKTLKPWSRFVYMCVDIYRSVTGRAIPPSKECSHVLPGWHTKEAGWHDTQAKPTGI